MLGGPHQLLRPSDVVGDLVDGASGGVRQPRSLVPLVAAERDDREHDRLTRLGGEGGAAGKRPMGVEQGAAASAGQVLALARREALPGEAYRSDVIQGAGKPSACALQPVIHHPGRHVRQQLVVAVHGAAETVVRAPPYPVTECIGTSASRPQTS
jgi:hypothetical protein